MIVLFCLQFFFKIHYTTILVGSQLQRDVNGLLEIFRSMALKYILHLLCKNNMKNMFSQCKRGHLSIDLTSLTVSPACSMEAHKFNAMLWNFPGKAVKCL
ncbi:hypothetical protein NQD34_006374 [Periophthalmus magnuspinnatus]|nr:hypothetical protein NQD34_006374 [Periophthalmus magnuspinnatus]